MQLELGVVADVKLWSELSDSEFLQRVAWKRSSPAGMAPAARKGDVAAFVELLRQYWAAGEPSPLRPCRSLWSLAAINAGPRELALAAIFASAPIRSKRPVSSKGASRPSGDQLEPWWMQVTAEAPLSMWEYLALVEMLPSRSAGLSASTLFSIWRSLLSVTADFNQLAHLREARLAGDAGQAELTRYGFQADPYLDLYLLRYCELPWSAGILFSMVKGAEKLRHEGAELLEHELVERTDDKGIPHADLLPRLPVWLAVSTRVLRSALERNITLWDADASELYCTLIEKVAPLIQRDGQFALSHVQVPGSREFAEEVLRTSGWPETEAALNSLFRVAGRRGAKRGKVSKTAGHKQSTARSLPLEICVAPVSQSDESAWALMRTHWGADADRAVVTYDQPAMNLELTIQGQPILSGEWLSEISSGNETHPFHGDWNSVCWQTDEDADFIEVQLVKDGVVRVERQIFLSRTSEFCIIAEAISEIPFDPFGYRTRLPLISGVKGTTSSKTREVRLTANDVVARVFPVSLPDQHVYSSAGKFNGDLQLQTTISGSAWYNSILIDWSAERRSADAIWKSLTVAEEQKAVRPDVAAGHRIKVGSRQWLIYRSLKQTLEARSVLGHQTRYETVFGNVEADGNITHLMLVEGTLQ